jgi:capsular polysaccharide export protein
MAGETVRNADSRKGDGVLSKGINSFSGKHVLLLQGPLGPFFRRLSRDLEASGARVRKVNFNGGDWLFYPTGAIQFMGRMEDWPAFLTKLLVEQKTDLILLHGDCRPIHQCVRELAERSGVELGVFEEGYVRPDYITLERGGINANSTLPRTRNFYLTSPIIETNAPLKVGNVFWHAALWAGLYYLASSIMRPFFPHYLHHRRLAIREALPWIRSLWRKCYYHIKERPLRQRLMTECSGRFFLVPLQVHYDAQMRVHSHYPSVEAFIHEVVESFAKHAGQDLSLVIKHHPMDRAYRDYAQLCDNLSKDYGLHGRLFYVHDLRLPDLLDHACGVVVVNSTVGLSALLHAVPVKVCGRAIYDIPKITYEGRLKDFWRDALSHKPDPVTLQSFRSYLIDRTQLNGSVYKRLPIERSRAGIVWNPSLFLLSVLTGEGTTKSHRHARAESAAAPRKQASVALAPYTAIVQRASLNP